MIKGILNISDLDSNSKYLGLPFMGEVAKRKALNFLCERAENKLAGWKQSLLSSARREVLIKSVMQVLLSFVMSSLAIMKSICDKLSSLARKF